MPCTKVRMNLIQQDVYVRDACLGKDLKNDYHIDSYVTQDEVIENGNVVTKTRIEPYPITAESVNSFADGTNYRLDLERAASMKPTSPNLGDVSAMKQLLSMSPDELNALRSRLATLSKPAADIENKEVNNG